MNCFSSTIKNYLLQFFANVIYMASIRFCVAYTGFLRPLDYKYHVYEFKLKEIWGFKWEKAFSEIQSISLGVFNPNYRWNDTHSSRFVENDTTHLKFVQESTYIFYKNRTFCKGSRDVRWNVLICCICPNTRDIIIFFYKYLRVMSFLWNIGVSYLKN